jgi:hypothetical protein
MRYDLVLETTHTGDNVQYNWPGYCPDIINIRAISGLYPGNIRGPDIYNIRAISGLYPDPIYSNDTYYIWGPDIARILQPNNPEKETKHLPILVITRLLRKEQLSHDHDWFR